MTTERALRAALKQPRDIAFQQQIDEFRAFEKRLESGGYVIQREKFSIPLMERVAPCRAPK